MIELKQFIERKENKNSGSERLEAVIPLTMKPILSDSIS